MAIAFAHTRHGHVASTASKMSTDCAVPPDFSVFPWIFYSLPFRGRTFFCSAKEVPDHIPLDKI